MADPPCDALGDFSSAASAALDRLWIVREAVCRVMTVQSASTSMETPA